MLLERVSELEGTEVRVDLKSTITNFNMLFKMLLFMLLTKCEKNISALARLEDDRIIVLYAYPAYVPIQSEAALRFSKQDYCFTWPGCEASLIILFSTTPMGEGDDARNSLKTSKAPGVDGIPVELIKRGGIAVRKAMLTLIQSIWNQNISKISGVESSLFNRKEIKWSAKTTEAYQYFVFPRKSFPKSLKED